MSNQGKKLLDISLLTKYYDLKKTKMFEKEIPTLKANDGISIDVYEGETLGIVGESGCGKSTFGRVLLQLYPTTTGSIHYSGASISTRKYSYVDKNLKNLNKSITKISRETLEIFAKEHEEVFSDINTRKTYTDISRAANLVGGLILSKHLDQVSVAMIAYYQAKHEKKEPSASVLQKLESLRNEVSEDPLFDVFEALKTDAVDIAQLKDNEMRPLRKDLQIIFQDPYSSLNPRLSVGQIIAEGLTAHGMFERGSAELDAYIKEIMKKCGLEEYFIHRYPHQFSGGQRQRIGIARALALKPKFVVCDEAVSALDVSIQSQIINLLMDLKEDEDLTYLFITHDLSVVKYISDRIGVMYLGNMCELGTTSQIFSNPLHPYTEALLRVIPTTEEKSSGRIATLEGDIPSPINPPKGCKFCTRCPKVMDKCKEIPPRWQELEDGHFVACHLYEK